MWQMRKEKKNETKRKPGGDFRWAGCGDCKGCSACCHGMGESIILDPYDLWRLTTNLKVTAGELLQEKLELHVVDGMILPNLRMNPVTSACGFLNAEGRCSIHEYRPGICRLFPLGRYYEDPAEGEGTVKNVSAAREEGHFRYFLQIHECPMPSKTKVKVGKWVDTPQLDQYEGYIRTWHTFLETVETQLPQMKEEQVKNVNLFVLKLFFLKPYEDGDFYPQFAARMAMARDVLEL